MTTTTTAVDSYIAGLRELADFLEARPTLAAKLPGKDFGIFLLDDNPEKAKAQLADYARMMGGHLQKAKVGGYYELRREFGPHKLTVNVSEKSFCERVVVGTETVSVPDPDAPLVEVEREVVEWRCPPILGAS